MAYNNSADHFRKDINSGKAYCQTGNGEKFRNNCSNSRNLGNGL